LPLLLIPTMADEPTPLRPAELEPNQHVITTLDGLLARARTGELRSIVFVARLPGGSEADSAGPLDDRDIALAIFDMQSVLMRARFP
jgi:hypothetical protein